MKKRWLGLIMALVMVLSQVIPAGYLKAMAAGNSFSGQVVVEGPSGVMVSGTTDKTNAFDALKEVLAENNYAVDATDSAYGVYINGIKNLATGVELSGAADYSSYWLYAVNRNNSYPDINVGISDFTLQNGDRLIVYLSDANTRLVNKIDYSTLLPDKPLTITLNSQNSWESQATPIEGVNVKIDGAPQTLTGNQIVLKDGLSLGSHTLEVSAYNGNSCPAVVGDTFTFNVSYPEASVRVEGLNGTLAEGTSTGANSLQIVENVLKNSNVQYSNPSGDYITSIGGLKGGDFGSMSGWMYYVKSKGAIVSPDVGMNDYTPQNGDDIVVYYGNYGSTPYVNSITFTPAIVKANQPFTMQFSYKHFDWSLNKDVTTPIPNAIVTIDNLNYITDSDGNIQVSGVSLGTHAYKISGYNINQLPTVVMDEGVFTIDNTNPPGFDYSDSSYNNIYDNDNTKIVKDIDAEINSTSKFIEGSQGSPWAAISLNKLRMKQDGSFLKNYSDDVKAFGVKDISNTDLEQMIMYLTAEGYSPFSFTGYNLVSELYNRNIKDFLVNDSIFGLLTYRYGNIDDSKYKIRKETLVSSLLGDKISYKSNGHDLQGWSLTSDVIDPDLTGAAIEALAPFYDSNPQVKEAVDKAVNSLSILENESGYIANTDGYYSEGLSFTIMGLASVGVNPEGILFTKTKGDLVSALLSFKGTGGQFKHTLDAGNDYMATEEALRALISLQQYKLSGKYDFYCSSINAAKLPIYPYTKQNNTGSTSSGSKNSSTSTAVSRLDNSGSGSPTRSGTTGIADNSSTSTAVTTSDNSRTHESQTLTNVPEDVIAAIKSATSGSDIMVDASNNSLVDKSIFEALAGLDKSLTIKYGDVSWTFKGSDIKPPVNDSIDVALNTVPRYLDQISSRYSGDNVYIVSFKEQGDLPAKASVRLGLDAKWLAGKNTNNLYLYYYNPQTGTAEKIEGPVTVDSQGNAVINIDKAGDYFFADQSILAAPESKTKGSSTMIIASAVLIIIALLMLVILVRKKKTVQ